MDDPSLSRFYNPRPTPVTLRDLRFLAPFVLACGTVALLVEYTARAVWARLTRAR